MKRGGAAKKMMRGGAAKKMMAGGMVSPQAGAQMDPRAMAMMQAQRGGAAPVGMKKGGKLKMVKKDGKSVPAFAADGVGKMKRGGKAKK
jgi:hypothetical protein